MALARPLTKVDQSLVNLLPTTAKPSLTLDAALARWYSELAAEGKSPATIAAYQYATGSLVKNVGEGVILADISPEHITGLIAEARAAGKSPSTVSALFRPLRTFFLWATRAGLVAISPVTMKPPKVPVGVVPDITAEQWAAVLATTTSHSRWAFRARRDRAILLILWTTGARLSEVAGLKLSDIDLQAGTFVVHGKGGKDRTLPLLPDALEALQTYLTLERPRSAFSSVSDAVWLTGKSELRGNGIAQMVRSRGAQAGVEGLHPHRFRHAFVGRCLAAGMSDSLVMALTGHSTHVMLARYGAATRAVTAMDALRALAG